VETLGRADRHDRVIGGVVLDALEVASLRIEVLEPRRVLIGEPPEFERLGAACQGAEGFQLGIGPVSTLPGHGLAKRGVRREQVHVGKGRALVEDLLV
jgi:hypothetical protein